VFALFLTIGYDAFFLSRALAASRAGAPVFPGVGNGVTPRASRSLGWCLRTRACSIRVTETV